MSENKWYEIKRYGDYGLGYKSFFVGILDNEDGSKSILTQKGKLSDGLEIYKYERKDGEEFRYTIASFERNEKEGVFELKEVGNRYIDIEMNDWQHFAFLCREGHGLLDSNC